MMSFGITKFGGTTGHNVRRTAAKGRGGRGIRTAAAPRLPHRGAVPRGLERLESRVLFATATWDGGGLDANWSTAANWVGDVAPLAADDLVFAAGAPQKTNTNDFAAGTAFNSITFQDGGYSVSGNGIQLAAGVSASNTTGSNTLGLGLTLTAAQAVNSANAGTALTLSGAIDNGGFAVALAGAGDVTASGVISGTGSLAKTGSGVATLSADNTYSGGTSLATGATLYANNTGLGSGTGSGPVSVADTTTLRGGGAASGAVTINAGGALRPGSTSAGTAAFKTGGLTFASSSTLGIDVGGTTAGSQYDQLVVAGSVDLGGSTLALSGSYAAAVGDGFIVVANDGTDAVTGTFSGLAEGALFTFNGATLQVSYAGGDGNDVVLTAVDPNEAPVVSVPGAQAAVEDVSLTLADVNAIQVSDDAGTNPVQVTLSVANGSITLGGTTGLTVSGNGTATVTAAGTLADLNAGLNGLVYTPALNFNGSDTLTASVDDQGNTGVGGAQTDTETVAITVSAANDAPRNTVPGAQTTNENTALVFSSANGNAVSLADVDAGTAAVTVTLTATDGTLTLGGTTGLTVSGDGTGSVSATGTVADLNAALEGLAYAPSSGFSGTDRVVVVTDDAGNTGSGGALSDSDSVNITVRDAGTLQFSAADSAVTEDGASATVTVTRTGGTAGTVDVSYATAAGTATAGTDYTNTSGTLTFLDGETSKIFTVSVADDLLDEDDETVALSLSGATGGADLGASSATLTITDNDPLPTLSVSDVTLTEGNSGTTNAVFTVTLSEASGRSVSVNYATADGTAAAGADYTAASGTVTFAAGDTSKSITVAVTGDTLFEGNEAFSVDLSAASNSTLADPTGAGTIADDETTPPSAFVNDILVTEGDAGTTNAVFTVQLTEALGSTATVDFSTGDGTAVAGTDYVAASGTLTFLSGETSKTVTVQVHGDLLDEENETLLLSLSNPTVVAVSDGESVGTITDDDAAPAVNVGGAVVTEGDTGSAQASFTVSLSAPSGKTVAVDFATEATGDAAAGTDFTPTSGTLTFAPGETSKTVVVEVGGDVLDEVDETFGLAVSNPSNASVSTGRGTGTIADNDPMPTLSIADADAEERLGGMTFTLSLSGPSGRQVSVDFATAGGTAASGADFTAAAGTVAFQPGETSKTIAVSVFADGAAEGDESFAIALSNAAGVTVADGQATGSILNAAPAAAADAALARPGQTIAVQVLANDVDADGDGLLVLAVSDPAGGTAAVAGDGTITYTPDATFVGLDRFTYTVGDGNGGTHEGAVTVAVEGTGLVQDPAQPGVTTLVVSADAASNEIRLERVRGGGLRVVVDGIAQDPVQAPDHLVILGGDGDDALVAGRLKVPVLFLGGDGSDTLGGGRKGNVLIGGPGDDTLYGGAGRDILIGGAGADTIRGLGGQDILISGTTAYDEDTAWNRQALRNLLEAWSGRGSVATRLASMRSEAGVGVGGARLTVDTVFDDGAADELIGGGGADAYFTNSEGGAATDILTGRTRTEGLFEV